jgi:hypothetical protein
LFLLASELESGDPEPGGGESSGAAMRPPARAHWQTRWNCGYFAGSR